MRYGHDVAAAILVGLVALAGGCSDGDGVAQQRDPATSTSAEVAASATAGQAAAAGASAAKLPKTGPALKGPGPKRPSAAKSAAAAAASTAAASASPSTGMLRYPTLLADEVEKTVKPQLAAAETLAHAVFRGPFGPSQATTVALTKRDDGGVTKFGGVLLFERDGELQKLRLPALHDQYSGMSIEAVAFVSEADADKVEELVILSRYITGIGKGGAQPFFATTVIDVHGSEVTRLKDMERLASNLDNIAAVRKRFREKTLVLRLDGAPVLIAPTLDRESIAARFPKVLGSAPTTDSAERIAFRYGQGKAAGQTCAFSFDARAALNRIEVSAPGDSNASASSLQSWLRRRGVKPTGKDKVWRYNGWRVTVPAPNKLLIERNTD